MIVGVDARELEGKITGVGVYLREILSRVQLPAGTEMLLFFSKEVPEQVAALPGTSVVLASGGGNFLWQQWTLCREAARRGVNFLFSPAYSLPWHFRGRQAVTVHDISFFRFPQWFSLRERISRQINAAVSVRQADRIYAVSEFVKQEICSRFRIPSSRILVTPNGVSPKAVDPLRRERLRAAHGHANDRIVLYVGSIFNRRRLPVLIEAMKHLDASCKLVVIGENRTHPRQDLAAEARRHHVDGRVTFLDFAPDAVVEEYYRMADALVYLSEYEGFGIPPLEAMSYGVPAVISATPAMNAIFNGAAAVAADFTAAAVSDAIRRVLMDPQERERLIHKGREVADHYSWDEAARIVSGDWEQILAACR